MWQHRRCVMKHPPGCVRHVPTLRPFIRCNGRRSTTGTLTALLMLDQILLQNSYTSSRVGCVKRAALDGYGDESGTEQTVNTCVWSRAGSGWINYVCVCIAAAKWKGKYYPPPLTDDVVDEAKFSSHKLPNKAPAALRCSAVRSSIAATQGRCAKGGPNSWQDAL